MWWASSHNPSPLRISPNPREFLLPRLVSGVCVDLVNTRLINWELILFAQSGDGHDMMPCRASQPIRGQAGGWLTNGRPALSAAASGLVTAEAGIQQLPLATDCSLTLSAASNAATTTSSMKSSNWITGCVFLLLLLSIASGWSLCIFFSVTKPCLGIWNHHSSLLSADKSDFDLCQDFLSTAPMTMTMTPTMRMRSMAMTATMTWRGGWSSRTITPCWTPGARGWRSPPGQQSGSSAASWTSAVSSKWSQWSKWWWRHLKINLLFLSEIWC